MSINRVRERERGRERERNDFILRIPEAPPKDGKGRLLVLPSAVMKAVLGLRHAATPAPSLIFFSPLEGCLGSLGAKGTVLILLKTRFVQQVQKIEIKAQRILF